MPTMEEKSKKATQEGADYEKKYKELVGKIEKAYLYALTDSTKAVLEEILPELQVSEDERIRKALLAIFNILPRNGYLTGSGITFDDAITWLEKQGEQKPKWSEEDSLMIFSIIDTLDWLKGKGATDMKIDWLKNLRKRMEEQQ